MFDSLKARLANSSSLARNMAWMAWSGSISIANSVIVWMVMARWRDAAEMGRFTLVMSLYLLFFTICSLGLNPYLVAEISRRFASPASNDEQSHNVNSLQSFLTNTAFTLLLWSGVCVGVMNLLGRMISPVSEVRTAVFVMSLTMPLTALMAVAEAYFTAFGRAKIIAAAATTENVLRTVLPIYLLLQGKGIVALCGSFVVARLIAASVYGVATRAQISNCRHRRPAVRWHEIKRLIRVVPTFAGITVLAALHLQMAVILLGRLGTEQDAAIYGVTSRFLIPFAILMSSYAAVLQPEAARQALQSLRHLADFLARSLRFVLPAALLVAVAVACLARPMLTLLFGTQYAEGALTLSLLIASAVPFCGVMILARGLIALQKQHIDLIGNAVAVGTSLLLGATLIPRYGATGAALAHLLSMVALFTLEITYLWQQVFRLELWPLLRKRES